MFAPERRDLGERAVHPLEAGDARRGQRPDRPGADRVDPDAVRPEVGREVADRRLERGLGHAHDVVVGDDLLGRRSRSGSGSTTRAWSSGRAPRASATSEYAMTSRASANPSREVSTNSPVEVLALGEGQGVDEDVELAVRLAPAVEDALDVVVRLDVARLDEGRADRRRPAAGRACSMRLSTEEKPTVAPSRVEGLGDAPGDRVVVGDPEDQRLLAVEQSHRDPPSSATLPIMPHATPPDDRSARAPCAGCGRCSSTSTGSSCSPARPSPARPRRSPTLERRAIPYRIVTNTSAVSRETLARWCGPDRRADPGRSASSRRCRPRPHGPARRFPGRRCTSWRPRMRGREFDGQRLLSPRGGRRGRGATAAAVVIGDSPEDATLRQPQSGVPARPRRRRVWSACTATAWWLTPEGPTLDSGAFVAGLEFAAGAGAASRQAIAGRSSGWPSRDLRRRASGRRASPRRRDRDGRRRRPDRCAGRPAGRAAGDLRRRPASTARRTSRRPPPSAAVGGPTRSRRTCCGRRPSLIE